MVKLKIKAIFEGYPKADKKLLLAFDIGLQNKIRKLDRKQHYFAANNEEISIF